jgi:hypothetical protein
MSVCKPRSSLCGGVVVVVALTAVAVIVLNVALVVVVHTSTSISAVVSGATVGSSVTYPPASVALKQRKNAERGGRRVDER